MILRLCSNTNDELKSTCENNKQKQTSEVETCFICFSTQKSNTHECFPKTSLTKQRYTPEVCIIKLKNKSGCL